MRPFLKLALVTSCFLTACGDGDSDFSGGIVTSDPFIRELFVDPQAPRVGEDVSIRVEFDPASQNDVNGGEYEALATDVLIVLPPGIDFVAESSDLDGDVKVGFRPRPPNTVQICSDGSRALTYELASGELSDFEEGRIRLLGKVFEARGQVNVEATARTSIGDPCGTAPDTRTAVTTVR